MHRAETGLTLKRWLQSTCRTLDFLQDRQANKRMFAEIWCNSSSAEGREEEGKGVEISDQTAYLQWLKWLKKERSTAQLQGHRQIFLCFHVCTRQKVISYWSSTKRRHKSYERPSGRIFCHHYCENECSTKMNVGPHRMGLKRTAGHPRALEVTM